MKIMLIRKRLIYLFVKDLIGGVSGEILENKDLRDFSSTIKSRNKVSLKLKVMVWLFILWLNMYLLHRVDLFTMNQTHDRQSAWFTSFIAWLIFEIIVSSTGIVLVIHLLIPLYVLTDLTKIKNKVVEILISFQRKYLRNKNNNNNINNLNEFNSVKYLFVSWKVASLFSDFQESEMILQFSSPFPTKKLVIQEEEKNKLQNEYEEGVILGSLTRLATYYLTSILTFPNIIQDTIIEFICNSGVGYLWITMYKLYKIQPLLPLVPIICVIIVIHFLMKSFNGESIRKLKSMEIVPILNDENDENNNNKINNNNNEEEHNIKHNEEDDDIMMNNKLIYENKSDNNTFNQFHNNLADHENIVKQTGDAGFCVDFFENNLDSDEYSIESSSSDSFDEDEKIDIFLKYQNHK